MFELLRQGLSTSRRPLFYWLTAVFNSVSKKRIKEVGPDIACAEWLLRNGASVKWKNSTNYSNDYNSLVANVDMTKKIQGVDATDSGISHDGFPHFENCKFIEDMKLVNCVYIGDNALDHLDLLESSLKNLEISNCGNVTDKGLGSLKKLSNLKILKLSKLQAIQDLKMAQNNLTKSLPNCQIIIE
ncbi:hypothetical protein HCN44_008081 [Aphidius gifuensis]|uniref:Mitochondrial ATP synthase regulatory component factor B n=1 Tax=Aphidius gifuensis TaxID=684658 RepID=A0A834XPS5_APHGI|nr:ATP synthase subunit s, mitochondrial [Aphidius gifuensis]KAF7989407.1 hypothetical protein HCN44_008081 [Aphidius gifuensis]